MPFHKKVHGSWFMVHGFKKETINYEQSTTNRKSRGFTLIELLIVIALIGIISSIGFYGYQSSQKKGRDARRKSDLIQVKRALEAAKNDCTGGSWYPYGDILKAAEFSGKNAFNDLLTDLTTHNYLNSDIKDPINDNTYFYGYQPDGGVNPTNLGGGQCKSLSSGGWTKNFVLRAKLEISNDPDIAKSFAACPILSVPWDNSERSILPPSPPATPNGNGYYYVCND